VPIWKIELIPEARADFKELAGSIKKQVLKQREDMEVYRIALKRISAMK